MARTRLAGWVHAALAGARAQLPAAPTGPRAINRRAALAMLAAASACTPSVDVKIENDKGTVAIVGGGMSGLVAAWRLAVAGVTTEIFESSGRLGGRMNTLRDFNADGQFCELGGEFVSSGDEVLIRLCGELGVGLQRLGEEGFSAHTAFDFGGRVFTEADLLEPVSQSGAFLPVAARIAADQAALLDAAGAWTERAKELDALPLSKYLDSLASSTERWVIDLLALAWQSEFGIPVAKQSSLNLVDMIGANVERPFAMFGKHDGAFRIAGGSSSLPEALAARLSETPLSQRATIHLRHALAAIGREAGGVKLRFRAEAGPPVEKVYGRVILALPFTRLREVKGLGGLALPADKMTVINVLGYGANAKLAVGTDARPWEAAVGGAAGPMTGTIYSDRGFQLVWDSSAGQPGPGGVLTNYLSGDAARGEEAQALARLQAGLASLAPDIARSLTPKVRTSFFWPSHPHTRGSYAGCLVGQYTSYPEIAARAELDGQLFFAGEHASIASMGTMNGAVDAGERAAKEVLAQLVRGDG